MKSSDRPTAANDDALRIAFRVAIAALIGAVLPIWPYGYYTFLRLIVTGVAIFAVTRFGTSNPRTTVGLAVVGLLFNPVFPVYLTRAIWLPIDLGIAIWFWRLAAREAD